MARLDVTVNLELDPWLDLQGTQEPDLQPGEGPLALIERIGVLPNGMQSGKASVAFVVLLPDGRRVFAETSLALFTAASRAILASPVAEMEDL